MAFQKGQPKTGGRQVGTPNKVTTEIKEFARSILEDPAYQTNLKQRLLAGDAPQIEQLLYHYVYGKPRQEVELHDNRLTVIVDRSGARSEIPVGVPVAGPLSTLVDHSTDHGEGWDAS